LEAPPVVALQHRGQSCVTCSRFIADPFPVACAVHKRSTRAKAPSFGPEKAASLAHCFLAQSFRKNLHYFDKYHRRIVAVGLNKLTRRLPLLLSGQGNWKWLAGPPKFQRMGGPPSRGMEKYQAEAPNGLACSGSTGSSPDQMPPYLGIEKADMPQTTHGRMGGLTFPQSGMGRGFGPARWAARFSPAEETEKWPKVGEFLGVKPE
jgi:hypothetical protein